MRPEEAIRCDALYAVLHVSTFAGNPRAQRKAQALQETLLFPTPRAERTPKTRAIVRELTLKQARELKSTLYQEEHPLLYQAILQVL